MGVRVAVGLRDPPPPECSTHGGCPRVPSRLQLSLGARWSKGPQWVMPQKFWVQGWSKAPRTEILGFRDGSRTLPVRTPKFLGAGVLQGPLVQRNPKSF